jgi:hypothetical protein
VHGTDAEAQGLRERFELVDDRAVLRFELARQLRLRALERVALDDRGDLLLEPLDDAVDRADERGTCPRANWIAKRTMSSSIITSGSAATKT